MAFFNDTFTAAATQELSAHTPDLGTSWTKVRGIVNDVKDLGSSSNLSIDASSDTFDASAGGAGLSDGALYSADVTYPSANYYVEATMTTLSTGSDDPMWLAVRVQDVDNFYVVKLLDQGGSNTCRLYKCVANTFTALGSAFNPPADGSVIKLEINGTSLKVYDDGVEVASATDSAISAAGKAGIGFGNLGQTSGEDSATCEWDNFSVTSLAATAAVTGTITPSAYESEIVAGGKTIIITLTGNTWVASGATFDGQRQNIINGLDAASSPSGGWNLEVQANQNVSGVVRTSDTVVTITLDAFGSYTISSNETITVTVPSTAVSGGVAITATPTFDIVEGSPPVVTSFTKSNLSLLGVG